MDEAGVEDVARIMALDHDVVVKHLVPLIEQPGTRRPAHRPHQLAAPARARVRGRTRGRRPPPVTLIDAARVELAPGGIRLTSIHPGVVATDRISGDGLPKPFEISQERAARHGVRALEREPAQAYFPWATTMLVRTLRALPTPVSSRILRHLAAG
ncbi:hypothetical protein ACIQI8_01715 [Streptomyces sp. NPDC092369]|uniref:hypothetical protein n=1 Tax=Streptomyces sp. NPDC092369 TaxID=3366015 RepID=UPI0038058908